MSKPRVALFGLGLMGKGMAKSLLSAGFPLTIYNRTQEKAAAFVAEGAKSATSPKDAADADILVSMVADDAASRSIWMGDHGALEGLRPGKVLVEASTLSLGWIKELAAAAEAKGCALLDAPVTGSREHAEAGQLKFLVGGSAAALEQARPALDAMGQAVIHLGPQGSGCLMKLINNFVCGVQVASLGEAMAVMERTGIDRDKAFEVMGQGAPGSPLFKAVFARMTSRDYDPHFHLELMAKDLGYACKEAKQVQVELKIVAAALERFNAARSAGLGLKDFAAVVEPLRNQAAPHR